MQASGQPQRIDEGAQGDDAHFKRLASGLDECEVQQGRGRFLTCGGMLRNNGRGHSPVPMAEVSPFTKRQGTRTYEGIIISVAMLQLRKRSHRCHALHTCRPASAGMLYSCGLDADSQDHICTVYTGCPITHE